MHYMTTNFEHFLSLDLRRIKTIEVTQDKRNSLFGRAYNENSKN